MKPEEIQKLMQQLNYPPIAKFLGIRAKHPKRAISARLRTLFQDGRLIEEKPLFVAYIRVLARNLILFADYLEKHEKND